MESQNNTGKYIGLSIAGVASFIVFAWLLVFGVQVYGRWNRLQNENNQTRINDIQISQTKQLVQVQKQKADIQVQEAYGIAKSQKIINDTLTPAYLQYEAIQAQEHEVNSNNHTVIYVPTGDNGIPLVQTVNP